MKILKTLTDVELVIVDLEVNLGDKKQNAPTLCALYEGKIIPLNTAHDGRPILMKIENAIPE
jgi:flagellar motor switch/type III secretory pathway protein FliN